MPNGVPLDLTEIARGTLGGATAVAEQLSGQVGAALLGTARDAFAQAFVVAAAVNAVLVLVTGFAAALMLHQRNSIRTG